MEPMRRTVEVASEFDRPPWAERKFSFVHPPWMLADFIERLRGTVPRLEALVLGVNDADAHLQVEGKWSIAQNIGHLSDVEELWQERLDDLKKGKKTYSPAVGARFQELAKRHQASPIKEIIRELKDRRSLLLMHLRRRHQNFSRRLLFTNAFKCRCASSTALSSLQSTTTITFCASEDCAQCLLGALANMPLHLTGP